MHMNELLLLCSTAMEDSATPPLSQSSPSITTSFGDKVQISRKRRIGSIVDMERVHREQSRRFQVTEMYSVLQSLLPNLPPKATRVTVVTETIAYIQQLEEEKSRLESLKKSIPTESMAAKSTLSQFSDPNSSVKVSLTGNVAFFGIQIASRPRLVSNIIAVFEKHRAEVLTANVFVNDERQLTVSVTAMVDGNGDCNVVDNIKQDILLL